MNAELLAWQIGRNIRFYRNRFGLTQKEVCALMNCDRRFYQRIEVGKARTTVNTLSRISGIFSTSIHELISINKLIVDNENTLLNFDWNNFGLERIGLWYRNRESVVVKVNHFFAGLVGLEAAEIIGKKTFHFMAVGNRDMSNIQTDCESIGLTNFYFSYFKENTRSFPLQVHPIPCFKINGEYLGSLSFVVPVRSNPNIQQLLMPFIEHLYTGGNFSPSE